MKETTKDILDGLSKVEDWFNKEFEALDLIEDGIGKVSIRSGNDWWITLNFKKKDIYITHRVIKFNEDSDPEVIKMNYRLKYTNFEMENFDEEVYEDFIQKSKLILINWKYYKAQIMNWYNNYKNNNDYCIKSIKEFKI